jgi:hypothetical protein
MQLAIVKGAMASTLEYSSVPVLLLSKVEVLSQYGVYISLSSDVAPHSFRIEDGAVFVQDHFFKIASLVRCSVSGLWLGRDVCLAILLRLPLKLPSSAATSFTM